MANYGYNSPSNIPARPGILTPLDAPNAPTSKEPCDGQAHVGPNSMDVPYQPGITLYKFSEPGLRIPLVQGGWLDTSWFQNPCLDGDQDVIGDGQTYWPAGRGGCSFGCFPYVTFENWGSNSVFIQDAGMVRRYNSVGIPLGSITYYEPASPSPCRAIANSSNTIAYEHDTLHLTYYSYWAGTSGPTHTGIPRYRIDRNGNALNFSTYTVPDGAAETTLLRKLTGSLGNVVPYFSYVNYETSRILLLDLETPANSRVQYYEYTNATTLGGSIAKMIFPGGCSASLQLEAYWFSDDVIYPALTSITDADGYRTYYAYINTENGYPPQLNRVYEPEGRLTYFTSDATNNISSNIVNNRRGKTFRSVIDSTYGNSQLRCMTDNLGRSTYYQWDALSNVMVQKLDPRKFATYYQYTNPSSTAINGITRVIDAANSATTYYIYTTQSDLHAMSGPRTRPGFPVYTYYEYDAVRNRAATTDALGHRNYVKRDTIGRVVADVDPRVNATYFNYHPVTGSMISQVLADGNVTYHKYNSFREMLRDVSPRWKETNFAAFTTYHAYDQRGRRFKTVDPLQNVTYFSYTNRCDLYSVTDARGLTTVTPTNGLRKITRMIHENAGGTVLDAAYFQWDVYKNNVGRINENGQRTYFAYDAEDQLIGLCDALGHSTYFGYDAGGNPILSRDALGRSTVVGYNAQSRVFKQVDALVNTTYYGYDLADNPIQQLDAMGRRSVTYYDALNRPFQAFNPLGNNLYFGYDAAGNPNLSRDLAGRPTAIGFDARNRPTTVTNALGQVSYFGYDASSNLSVVQNPLGNRTLNSYDALDRLSAIVDAFSQRAYFGYDAVGNHVVMQDQLNNRTAATFDLLRRQTQQIDAAGGIAYFGYDRVGNPTLSQNALGFRTTVQFDAVNRPIAIIDAMAGSTYFGYDAVGNRTVVQDPLGNRAQTNYDPVNRPSLAIMPTGDATYFGYDRVGNRTVIQDPRGGRTYWAYDAVNRVARLTDAVGASTYFGYDAANNLVMSRNAFGFAQRMAYDPLNRVRSLANPLLQTSYFAYDATGNRNLEVDPDGNVSYFGYDALNRLVVDRDAAGVNAQYFYDAASNLLFTFDRNYSGTQFLYDALNRRRGIIYGADGGYGFGPYGSTPYGSGGTPAFQYFTYDAVGNLTGMLDQTGASSFRFDVLNRQTKHVDARGNAAYFTYDAASNLKTLTYPGGNPSAYYAYDVDNRVRRATSASSQSTYYRYDAAGNVSFQVFGNTAKTYYRYDADNRVIGIRHVTAAAVQLAYFDYQRDVTGRIVRCAREGALVQYFQYDNADRVILERWSRKAMTGTAAQIYAFSYSYDAAGNRLRNYRVNQPASNVMEKTYYSYGTNNTLLKRFSSNAAALAYYAYNANGSLIRIDAPAGHTYFGYAPNGMIATIAPPGVTAWTFANDGALNRVKINKGGTPTYYFWNGMSQLEERSATGTLTARYTHGRPLLPGIGSVVEAQQVTATTTYYQYLHLDQQGSVALVTDANQNVLIRYGTDAFGRQMTNPTGTFVNVPNGLQFQTDWFTVVIGGRQYGLSPSRVYDMELGRFLQRDPLPTLVKLIGSSAGNAYGVYDRTVFGQFMRLRQTIQGRPTYDLGGKNSYVFASANPNNKVDPLGLIDWDGWEGWAAGVADTGLGYAAGGAEFLAGAGDAVSFGATTHIAGAATDLLGSATGTQSWNNSQALWNAKQNSGAFTAGQVAGTAATLAYGAVSAARLAGGLSKVPYYELGQKWIPGLHGEVLAEWSSLSAVERGEALAFQAGGFWRAYLTGNSLQAFSWTALKTLPTPLSGTALLAFLQAAVAGGTHLYDDTVNDNADSGCP